MIVVFFTYMVGCGLIIIRNNCWLRLQARRAAATQDAYDVLRRKKNMPFARAPLLNVTRGHENDTDRSVPDLQLTINKLCGRPPQYAPRSLVDLWPFDLESGVRVTCDVAYLCANFSLPRPLCSRPRPDVRDRQTDVRRTTSLNAPIIGAGA